MKAEDMLKARKGSRITVKTFFFASEFVADLQDNTTEGILGDFDKDSEYCSWTDLNGNKKPHVHINCVELSE